MRALSILTRLKKVLLTKALRNRGVMSGIITGELHLKLGGGISLSEPFRTALRVHIPQDDDRCGSR